MGVKLAGRHRELLRHGKEVRFYLSSGEAKTFKLRCVFLRSDQGGTSWSYKPATFWPLHYNPACAYLSSGCQCRRRTKPSRLRDVPSVQGPPGPRCARASYRPRERARRSSGGIDGDPTRGGGSRGRRSVLCSCAHREGRVPRSRSSRGQGDPRGPPPGSAAIGTCRSGALPVRRGWAWPGPMQARDMPFMTQSN